jgi:hypothetical protein
MATTSWLIVTFGDMVGGVSMNPLYGCGWIIVQNLGRDVLSFALEGDEGYGL